MICRGNLEARVGIEAATTTAPIELMALACRQNHSNAYFDHTRRQFKDIAFCSPLLKSSAV
jgi:hypothetical protein